MSPEVRAALREILRFGFWAAVMLTPCAALGTDIIAIAIYSQ